MPTVPRISEKELLIRKITSANQKYILHVVEMSHHNLYARHNLLCKESKEMHKIDLLLSQCREAVMEVN